MGLQVHSIFETISGEAGGFPQGTWVTVVRLQGCNLAGDQGKGGCRWCDTPLAKHRDGRDPMSVRSVVAACSNQHVLITGGEPLAQGDELVDLITELQFDEHIVQVETNGSLPLPIPAVLGVHWVVDYKLPSSGQMHLMQPLDAFAEWVDQEEFYGGEGSVSVKMVIADKIDMHTALTAVLPHLRHVAGLQILISPINGKGGQIEQLVKQIKEYDPEILDQIVFSVQLHKLINMP